MDGWIITLISIMIGLFAGLHWSLHSYKKTLHEWHDHNLRWSKYLAESCGLHIDEKFKKLGEELKEKC